MAEEVARRLSAQELALQPLFRGASLIALEWLRERCRVRELPPDTVLLRPDSASDQVFIVLQGHLRVQLDAQGSQVLAFVSEGNCVGEMSVIERVPPSAIVATHTDCRLLEIDGEVLRLLIERSHAVARNLLYLLSSRIRHDNLLVMQSLQQQEIFEHNSKIDTLTGLFNRRGLDELLHRTYRRHLANDRPMSLLMMDLDHFKAFNDNHGHLAGDRALAAVASALQGQIRTSDSAARYGGEEFVVVMPDTCINEARAIAQRLCIAVRNLSLPDDNHPAGLQVTVSIGVATLAPDQTPEQLLAAADRALYAAKSGGRDQVSG